MNRHIKRYPKQSIIRCMIGSEGFTLIEIMAAISLTAIIMAFVAQAFQAGVNSWSSAGNRTDLMQSGRYLISRISSDLQNSYLSKTNALYYFQGDSYGVHCVVPGGVWGFQTIEYRFDPGYRAVFRKTADDPESLYLSYMDEPFLEGVQKLAFRYYDATRKTWLDYWDSRQVGARLPDLIEIRLSLQPSGSQEPAYDFPPTAFKPMVSQLRRGPRLGR